MSSTSRVFLAAFCGLVLLIARTGLAVQLYHVNTLPNVSGLVVDSATAISAAGQVAGAANPAGFDNVAFHYAGGTMHDIGDLPGGYHATYPTGVNDSGQVVGASEAGDGYHAIIWTSATGMQIIPGTSVGSNATDINNSGQVVGYNNNRAFRWSSASGLQELTAPPGATVTSSTANSINASGQVAGYLEVVGVGGQAVRWSSAGVAEYLPNFSTPATTFATAINDLGHVAGGTAYEGESRMFFWSGGALQAIGSLPHDPLSYWANEVHGINNQDQIVGRSGDWAFVWTPASGILKIDDYLDASSVAQHWRIFIANDINNAGQIAAWAWDYPVGSGRGVVLNPVNDSVIAPASASFDLGNFLLNGSQVILPRLNLNKTGRADTTYSATPSSGLTVIADGVIPDGDSLEQVMLKPSSNADGNAAYGRKTYMLTVHNSTTSGAAAAGQGPEDPNDVITVTAVIGLATTSGTSFGAKLFGDVPQNTSYAGLASRTSDGATDVIENGAVVVGTEARLLGGFNGPGLKEMVAMRWRARTVREKSRNEGGAPTSPPLPPGPAGAPLFGLISDVVELSALDYQGDGDATGRTDPYVLQLSYDNSKLIGGPSSEVGRAAAGAIYLAWLNPRGLGLADDRWENAVNGNFNNSPVALINFQGSYAAAGSPMVIGSWGVDTATHTVWAVLDHASEFAVLPEPSTFALALGGAMVGLFCSARRGVLSRVVHGATRT